MSAATDIGELSYGSFYLPSVAFAYLSTQPNNPLIGYFPAVTLPGPTLKPVYLFYILTAISFVGAIQGHGIARAIYGPDGPAQRPKHKSVQVQHTLSIVLSEDVENIPIIPCRIATDGILFEILDFIQYKAKEILYQLARNPTEERKFKDQFGPIVPEHRLNKGIKQLQDITQLLSWWKVPRVVYFVPMGFQKISTWAAFIALTSFVVLGSVSYVALLLIFAHIVLLFRNLFWAPIPNYLNVDALDDRFTPEYKLKEEENE